MLADDPPIILILAPIVGGILLIALLIAYANHRAKKRTEAFRQLADELGLAFTPSSVGLDDELLAPLQRMPLIRRGSTGGLKDLISGETNAVDLVGGSFTYTTGSGKNRTVHRHGFFLFVSPQLRLPEMQISREGFGHKLITMMGYQDIDFDDSPDFSKRFLVRGESEDAIREFLTRDLRDELPSLLDHGRLTLETHGEAMLVQAGLFKPEQFRERMAEAFAIFAALRDACEQETRE